MIGAKNLFFVPKMVILLRRPIAILRIVSVDTTINHLHQKAKRENEKRKTGFHQPKHLLN